MALARLCLPAVLLPHVVAAYTFVWVHIPTSTCRLAAVPSPQPPVYPPQPIPAGFVSFVSLRSSVLCPTGIALPLGPQTNPFPLPVASSPRPSTDALHDCVALLPAGRCVNAYLHAQICIHAGVIAATFAPRWRIRWRPLRQPTRPRSSFALRCWQLPASSCLRPPPCFCR